MNCAAGLGCLVAAGVMLLVPDTVLQGSPSCQLSYQSNDEGTQFVIVAAATTAYGTAVPRSIT